MDREANRPETAHEPAEPIGYAAPADRRTVLTLLLALGGPSVFLVLLGIRYHLADLACEEAWARVALEGATGAGLLMIAGLAGSAWRMLGHEPDEGADPSGEGRWLRSRRRSERLLLQLACLLGALFTLLQIAQWIPQWIVGPCS